MLRFFSFCLLSSLILFCSCEKLSLDKGDKELCSFDFNLDELAVGSWDRNAELNMDATKEYEVENLVYSEDCDCIISGFMKYVENGKTKFLIQYGDGECDTWATKTTCFNGDCCNKESFTEKFAIESCASSHPKDGE